MLRKVMIRAESLVVRQVCPVRVWIWVRKKIIEV